jgi:hypothetical protein
MPPRVSKKSASEKPAKKSVFFFPSLPPVAHWTTRLAKSSGGSKKKLTAFNKFMVRLLVLFMGAVVIDVVAS